MSLLSGIKVLWKQMGEHNLSEELIRAEALSSGCRCRHFKSPPGFPLEEQKQKQKSNKRELHHIWFPELGIWNSSNDEWRERRPTYIFILHRWNMQICIYLIHWFLRSIKEVLTVLLNFLVQLQAYMPSEQSLNYKGTSKNK